MKFGSVPVESEGHASVKELVVIAALAPTVAVQGRSIERGEQPSASTLDIQTDDKGIFDLKLSLSSNPWMADVTDRTASLAEAVGKDGSLEMYEVTHTKQQVGNSKPQEKTTTVETRINCEQDSGKPKKTSVNAYTEPEKIKEVEEEMKSQIGRITNIQPALDRVAGDAVDDEDGLQLEFTDVINDYLKKWEIATRDWFTESDALDETETAETAAAADEVPTEAAAQTAATMDEVPAVTTAAEATAAIDEVQAAETVATAGAEAQATEVVAAADDTPVANEVQATETIAPADDATTTEVVLAADDTAVASEVQATEVGASADEVEATEVAAIKDDVPVADEVPATEVETAADEVPAVETAAAKTTASADEATVAGSTVTDEVPGTNTVSDGGEAQAKVSIFCRVYRFVFGK